MFSKTSHTYLAVNQKSKVSISVKSDKVGTFLVEQIKLCPGLKGLLLTMTNTLFLLR